MAVMQMKNLIWSCVDSHKISSMEAGDNLQKTVGDRISANMAAFNLRSQLNKSFWQLMTVDNS